MEKQIENKPIVKRNRASEVCKMVILGSTFLSSIPDGEENRKGLKEYLKKQ